MNSFIHRDYADMSDEEDQSDPLQPCLRTRQRILKVLSEIKTMGMNEAAEQPFKSEAQDTHLSEAIGRCLKANIEKGNGILDSVFLRAINEKENRKNGISRLNFKPTTKTLGPEFKQIKSRTEAIQQDLGKLRRKLEREQQLASKPNFRVASGAHFKEKQQESFNLRLQQQKARKGNASFFQKCQSKFQASFSQLRLTSGASNFNLSAIKMPSFSSTSLRKGHMKEAKLFSQDDFGFRFGGEEKSASHLRVKKIFAQHHGFYDPQELYFKLVQGPFLFEAPKAFIKSMHRHVELENEPRFGLVQAAADKRMKAIFLELEDYYRLACADTNDSLNLESLGEMAFRVAEEEMFAQEDLSETTDLALSNLFQELWLTLKVFASDLTFKDLSPWKLSDVPYRDQRIAFLLSKSLEQKFCMDLNLSSEMENPQRLSDVLEEQAEAFIQKSYVPNSDFPIYGFNNEGRDVFPYAALFLHFMAGSYQGAQEYASKFSKDLGEFIQRRLFLLQMEDLDSPGHLEHIEAQQLVPDDQATDPYLNLIIELLNGYIVQETLSFNKEVLWGDVNCIIWAYLKLSHQPRSNSASVDLQLLQTKVASEEIQFSDSRDDFEQWAIKAKTLFFSGQFTAALQHIAQELPTDGATLGFALDQLGLLYTKMDLSSALFARPRDEVAELLRARSIRLPQPDAQAEIETFMADDSIDLLAMLSTTMNQLASAYQREAVARHQIDKTEEYLRQREDALLAKAEQLCLLLLMMRQGRISFPAEHLSSFMCNTASLSMAYALSDQGGLSQQQEQPDLFDVFIDNSLGINTLLFKSASTLGKSASNFLGADVYNQVLHQRTLLSPDLEFRKFDGSLFPDSQGIIWKQNVIKGETTCFIFYQEKNFEGLLKRLCSIQDHFFSKIHMQTAYFKSDLRNLKLPDGCSLIPLVSDELSSMTTFLKNSNVQMGQLMMLEEACLALNAFASFDIPRTTNLTDGIVRRLELRHLCAREIPSGQRELLLSLVVHYLKLLHREHVLTFERGSLEVTEVFKNKHLARLTSIKEMLVEAVQATKADDQEFHQRLVDVAGLAQNIFTNLH